MAFARQLLPRRGLWLPWTRHIFSSAVVRHERLNEVLPPLECFTKRHIGPSEQETEEMLKACGVEASFVCCLFILSSKLLANSEYCHYLL